MELAIFIVIVFAGLVGVIFAYQWAVDKLGLDIKPQQKQPQAQIPIITQGNLYDFYRMDYENFAVGVFDCLTAIAKRYNLLQVYDPRAVYSSRVADRVRIFANERIVFVYEIRREVVDGRKIGAAYVAAVFEEDLQSYLTDGYYYDGHVVGFDIDEKTVRIEIYGVNRQVPNYGGNYGNIIV